MTTILLVYFFTGKWTLSIGVGIAEVVVKTAIYYFHERAWDMTDWGEVNE